MTLRICFKRKRYVRQSQASGTKLLVFDINFINDIIQMAQCYHCTCQCRDVSNEGLIPGKYSGNHTKAHHNQIAENQECRTNLKSSQKEKSHIFQRNKDKSNESSCPQMVQIRRQWRNIFKVLKINNNQTEILCSVKIFFKNKS